MSNPSPGPEGWLESFRCIGETMLAMLRNRLELFSVEAQEEKLRLIHLLIWISVAAAFGFAGVFIVVVVVACWLWTMTGYVGLIGLAVIALAVAWGILSVIRRNIQTGPPPFSNTVAEFRKDGECLRRNK